MKKWFACMGIVALLITGCGKGEGEETGETGGSGEEVAGGGGEAAGGTGEEVAGGTGEEASSLTQVVYAVPGMT